MESVVFIYSTIHGSFSHLPLWVFYILLFIGLADIAAVISYRKKEGKNEEDTDAEMVPYLRKIGRYVPINRNAVSIPLGMSIVIFAFTHYLLGIGSSGIGDGDMILILLGAFLMIYPSVPQKYGIERDFILTFLGLLAVFMTVLPFLFDFGEETFTYYFLTYPVHNLLNLIGVKNVLIPPNRISFPYNGVWGVVIIARSCSGIYSLSIFMR